MVNFNVEGLDKFEKLGEGAFGNFLASFGALAAFLAILIGIAIVILWVFGSIGLMNQAKKKGVPNAWLAFVPIGRSYLLGKLGFEIYDNDNKNATTFMWITLALGAASFVLGSGNGDLKTLVEYALLFFESWAFYNIFKKENPKNAVVYTVFTVLTQTLLGGLFLYLQKDTDTNESIEEATVVSETKDEEEKVKKDNVKESKKVKNTEKNTFNFCSNCGSKLVQDAKFCPVCGKKVN